MPVIDVTTDTDALTLTITAEYAGSVERVWEIYADARQLERVWGPPTYPATFVDHKLTPGSRSTYYMTSPEGQKYPGWWEVTAVEEPRSFEFDDGFATDAETFATNESMPVSHNVYRFEPLGQDRTQATYVGVYQSAEGLQQVLDMGMIEGSKQAMGQIDELLAAG